MTEYRINLLESLRGQLIGILTADSGLITLLCGENEEYEKRSSVLWSRLIPQDFVPGIVTKTGTHLLFDINERALYPKGSGGLKGYDENYTKSSSSEFTLTFWSITHRMAPLFGGRLRNDAVCASVKRLLLTERTLSPGGVHLISDTVADTGSREHTGRKLVFIINRLSDTVKR